MENSLIIRMNIKEEIIYLIEEFYFLKDSSSSMNDSNSLENIIVKFENLGNIEKNKFRINDLKKNFDFIKIINNKNEINVLVLNNKNYSAKDILQKINSKPFFANEIKRKLNVNFPLNDYFLEEKYKNNKYIFDRIYFLFKFSEKNNKINNINNQIDNNINLMNSDINFNSTYNNNINNNDILERLNALEKTIDETEKKFQKQIDDNSKEKNAQLDNILILLKQKLFNKIEKKYLSKINNFNILYPKEYNRNVFIKIKNNEKFLCITSKKEVLAVSSIFPWNIQINYSNKTIIPKFNNYYLKEENGIIEGDSSQSILNFEIMEINTYCFYSNNNKIIYFDEKDKKIKVSQNTILMNDNSKFELIETANEIENFDDSNSSFLDEKIIDLTKDRNSFLSSSL